ncbi:hypothetical protein RVBP21_3750 [Pseudomonas phage BRkr]|nr:hypothetical protein RVBP21_3750 [Pseudomonas phage BRkr]
MQEQAKEEMFPRSNKSDPNVPPSWVKLEYVVIVFVISLVATIIFNGF